MELGHGVEREKKNEKRNRLEGKKKKRERQSSDNAPDHLLSEIMLSSLP